jgi:hypothetical protein
MYTDDENLESMFDATMTKLNNQGNIGKGHEQR